LGTELARPLDGAGMELRVAGVAEELGLGRHTDAEPLPSGQGRGGERPAIGLLIRGADGRGEGETGILGVSGKDRDAVERAAGRDHAFVGKHAAAGLETY